MFLIFLISCKIVSQYFVPIFILKLPGVKNWRLAALENLKSWVDRSHEVSLLVLFFKKVLYLKVVPKFSYDRTLWYRGTAVLSVQAAARQVFLQEVGVTIFHR